MIRTLILVLLCSWGLSAQEGHRIAVEVEGYDEEFLTLGYYLLDNQYIVDTAYRQETGQYVFSSDTASLDPGIYLVVLAPDNDFFQLLIGNEEDQRFTLRTHVGRLNEVEVSGSRENELFYEYLTFLSDAQAESAGYRGRTADPSLTEDEQAELTAALDELDQRVRTYQQALQERYPESFVALIIQANKTATPPDYAEIADEEERKERQWRWLQTNYFDGMPLQDPRLLRTPFLFSRIDYYVNKLQLRHPDTLARAIDFVLDQLDPESETYKYYTVHFTNEAASSNIVGMDALYVHMVDTYYRTGRAPWTEGDQLAKMIDNADRLKPLLIGKKAPDLAMTTREGEDINLHDLNAKYTVLYFWRYDCAACKKSTPIMKEFYAEWKDRGVEIFSVCTKGIDELGDCWDYVDEHDIGNWVQVADPYQRYYKEYDIRSTPTIFLLDRDKTIVSKRIGAEQLDEVLSDLVKREEAETAGK
jgi:peroxiredoxin